MTHPDVGHQLRLAGLRVTRPRESVLEWLAEHPHTTADQIRAGIVQRLGSVSTQAVYNVLAALTQAGLVRRIEPAGHPARFERRVGDNAVAAAPDDAAPDDDDEKNSIHHEEARQ